MGLLEELFFDEERECIGINVIAMSFDDEPIAVKRFLLTNDEECENYKMLPALGLLAKKANLSLTVEGVNRSVYKINNTADALTYGETLYYCSDSVKVIAEQLYLFISEVCEEINKKDEPAKKISKKRTLSAKDNIIKIIDEFDVNKIIQKTPQEAISENQEDSMFM